MLPIGTIDVVISKANRTESFEWEALPDATRAYVVDYGLRQCIVDKVAGVARKDFPTDAAFHAAAWAACEKRVNQLRTGDVPTARVPSDPATLAARKLAAEIIAAGGVDAWTAMRATPAGDSTTAVGPDSTLKKKKVA